MSTPLLNAMRRQFPEAKFELLAERPWYSGGAAGHIIRYAANFSGEAHNVAADRLESEVGEADFSALGLLVADMAVVKRHGGAVVTRLWIDALVIED